jgi:hypothetical protein
MIDASCMEENHKPDIWSTELDSLHLRKRFKKWSQPERRNPPPNPSESKMFACPKLPRIIESLTSSTAAQLCELPNPASPLFLLIYQNGQLPTLFNPLLGLNNAEHLCTLRLILQSRKVITAINWPMTSPLLLGSLGERHIVPRCVASSVPGTGDREPVSTRPTYSPLCFQHFSLWGHYEVSLGNQDFLLLDNSRAPTWRPLGSPVCDVFFLCLRLQVDQRDISLASISPSHHHGGFL